MSEQIETMRHLADWITEYNWDIYYNQKNKDGYPIFRGPSSKPDMLLKKDNYNILVEVKPCHDHNDILDGFQQTLEYAGKYWSGRSSNYRRNGKQEDLQIDAFVLATQYSRDGFLYKNEQNTGTLEYTYLAKKKQMDEYPISHTVARLMWREWNDGKYFDYYRDLRRSKQNQVEMPKKPKIGTIASKIDFETKQPTDHPHLFMENKFVPMGCKDIYAFD